MLESTLHQLIPSQVNAFAKLGRGEPYHFDHWADDRSGSECLYYWFTARDGVKKNTKRIPVSEIRAALHQLRTAGVLTRVTFQIVCPVSQACGPCGFAVVGRILEALIVARYTNTAEFSLTNAARACSLLEIPQRK